MAQGWRTAVRQDWPLLFHVYSNQGVQAAMRIIPADAAHICFHNDVYHIYRQDGYYAREVMTARTLFAAEKFCNDNKWRIIR